MIGLLRGKILHRQPPFLLVDVNGVGYELEAPMSTFYALPESEVEVVLHTHLVVREDAQLLFGFSDLSQRQLFRSLLKINGVGPKVGLAILSTLSTEDFVRCIHHEDAAMLTRVPGIGKKTAERMIIDMRDRIDELGGVAQDSGVAVTTIAKENPVQDAIGALVALGYKAAEASKAVKSVEGDQTDELIRNALQYISKR